MIPLEAMKAELASRGQGQSRREGAYSNAQFGQRASLSANQRPGCGTLKNCGRTPEEAKSGIPN